MEGKRGGNGYATVPQPQKKPSPKVDARSGDSEGGGPDGYRHKPDGLMKQSFSITTSSGQHLRLISYYARSSPSASNLLQPSTDPNLRHIRPPKNMYPESTVNDPQVNMPTVTRAPMASPGFSAGSPQPNAGSPYQRAPMGPTYIPQQPGWPPTPSATPHGTYAIHHAYLPHVGPPPTHLDRVPPPISNSQVPPAPQHHHPSSQSYPHSFTTRAPQTSYPAPHHYPHTTEPGPQLPPVGTHAGSDHHSSNRPSSGGRPQPFPGATRSPWCLRRTGRCA
ncbi:hypothetical protein EJ05DRAFT_481127 [Pseudovirgaria hyperparasitica]|uniref:Uncharacterized protein n=1 Tax=Pseudovirgaria hyperparasitica TaxID=470096 RepID=A0A6A6VPR6_9PEZI|nr:uncharacterized protein EJ05DRAFT_481127 [Pseudovirgaria hyperparasitica]KAF2752628.1 hypothetical protein EJ05DRAFT_481127 [Pseudovirgaria hyperparasitica]